MRTRTQLTIFVGTAVICLSGCTRIYYEAMEKIGKEKRDILASRIAEGKKDQEKAKKQFQTTLEAFQAVTGFQGGSLEKTYKKLNAEFESAEARAKDVRDQINSIDQVSKDMFREWGKEIDGMHNADLRNQSRVMLRDSQKRYVLLIQKMRDSERRMAPVLQGFRDQVFFLKHNLNARAVSSLKGTAAKLDTQVTGLVQDLDASIKEADEFIVSLKKAGENQ